MAILTCLEPNWTMLPRPFNKVRTSCRLRKVRRWASFFPKKSVRAHSFLSRDWRANVELTTGKREGFHADRLGNQSAGRTA